MKKLIAALLMGSLAFMLLATLQGCLKDSCQNTYTIYTPVYKKLSMIRAQMKSSPARKLENTGKIYVYGQYIFMNELKKGIHVIDNSDASNPRNISFINIPGNVDLVVKGNRLYADCYSDIVVFDISDPKNVSVVKFMDNVIPEFGYYWGSNTSADSVDVLVDYVARDTTVDCETYQNWMKCNVCLFSTGGGDVFLANLPSAMADPGGKGGSMARFSLVNNYMYGVSSYQLYAFNLSNPSDPVLANKKIISGGIETIYPFKDKLFIGSVAGMFIYDISNPADPVMLSSFSHASSCDPVITDGATAYVTLRSGNACQGFTNQMEVLNVSNLNNPVLMKTYPMSNPHGLAKDGDLLFLCDGKAGLKVYNAADPMNLQLIKKFEGMETYDVISWNGKAIVVAKEGLYQYSYGNGNSIQLLSKLPISR